MLFFCDCDDSFSLHVETKLDGKFDTNICLMYNKLTCFCLECVLGPFSLTLDGALLALEWCCFELCLTAKGRTEARKRRFRGTRFK